MQVTSGEHRVRTREGGFTLIELLVVVTILGILASVALVNFVGRDDDAKVAAVKSELGGIMQAANMFKLDHGRWPDGIDELLSPPDSPSKGRVDPYMQSTPSDPWTMEPYIWEVDERGMPSLMSYGSDMQEGGEGHAQDIYSSERRR